MKPQINISNNYIEIIGHYDDSILCAKLTYLCQLYAEEFKSGYAKFQYSQDILDALNKIDDSLLFKTTYTTRIYINNNLVDSWTWSTETFTQYTVTAVFTDAYTINFKHNDSVYYTYTDSNAIASLTCVNNSTVIYPPSGSVSYTVTTLTEQSYTDFYYTTQYPATLPKVNVDGTWKETSSAYVNIGGTWKEVSSMHTNIGGTWKELTS